MERSSSKAGNGQASKISASPDDDQGIFRRAKRSIDDLITQARRFRLKTKQQELLIRVSALLLIYVLAFATRLFSVLRYESVIHEFDPYFNYRTTLYLTQKGFYEFWNWFDYESWYPLGRIIGGTLYPGLMVTAALLYWTLRLLSFAVHIRDVCVLTAPFFASNTAMVGYFFGKELKDPGTGLVAAAFLAICPGYISRSVAGSYDNEGVAIFALLLTFYLFVKAVNTGSLAWAVASAFAYFYMVSAWGGYIFIINLLPIYVLVLLVTGRYSLRLYVAYNTLYVLGMLLAMQIRFVGFQHVQSGEHMAAMGVFFLMQVFYLVNWVKSMVEPKLFQAFLKIAVIVTGGAGALALGVGMATGYISPWTGRFYSLLDPTYAKDHIPIIASVSEHQPTAWSSFMFDYHLLLFLFPAGLFFCFRRPTDATIFIMIYGLTSLYFAGVMVRLILVATPAVCLIGAIAVSSTLKNVCGLLREKPVGKVPERQGKDKSKGGSDQSIPFQREACIVVLAGALYLLTSYALHCTWVTSEAYSSPSIVLAARQSNGDRVIFDDFREAYFWLQHNTPPDAKVMSWWDYGYQITAMGNRTVIVDNNTWNNTHIATVGRAMSSYEDEAYEIMRSLDVDYVLVVFGGVTGYSSDDINKFLWMVRIGGGVFPVIKESDYLNNGEYRIDAAAAPKMLECLMYKLCYYRFGEVSTEYGKPPGWDRARGTVIGKKDFELEYLDEAFTTSNWIVRIYKLKPPANRK
ncbi:oligosaccharyltransferase subunit STT3 [Selaginella moellendorffii]|uniref:dolichyl-diphosphooligosaccharide--protein glycotransferase n=1 Tax=Selaginella moellendorffii TaxID=88036 RepID=D8S7P7_SELML|nr:dolichyl-diphosphooligosaccharide--protein glycosyltransferase subunit STT3B [Selaginella moellendorffii]EFJ19648.1 oligosaccharyltransferase subunit STT3 [Selaginella moellendorffii]|eukprot:XP_002979240.1 dolichyl-diphosphooligosaccharide--protein glycosyltransferase subunit STT3B [Selaginella moellendorffii]